MQTEDFSFSRRALLVAGSAAAIATRGFASAQPVLGRSTTSAEPAEAFTLPALPWKEDALAPVISANTISFHYGKHHKAYVDNLNKLVEEKKKYAAMNLEAVVKASYRESADAAVFNNAAQVWNHTFYWNSLNPTAVTPTGALLERIQTDFGGLDACKTRLVDAAKSHFGSGWAWLVVEGGKLAVVTTSNAETPLTTARKPLLVIDVWEHAYYLDHQNKRADYVQGVAEKFLNWEFAAKNLG